MCQVRDSLGKHQKPELFVYFLTILMYNCGLMPIEVQDTDYHLMLRKNH
jgi:hypothetical protein